MDKKKILWIEGNGVFDSSASSFVGHSAFANYEIDPTRAFFESLEKISSEEHAGVYVSSLRLDLPTRKRKVDYSFGGIFLADQAIAHGLPVLVRPSNEMEAIKASRFELFRYNALQEFSIPLELALSKRFGEVFG